MRNRLNAAAYSFAGRILLNLTRVGMKVKKKVGDVQTKARILISLSQLLTALGTTFTFEYPDFYKVQGPQAQREPRT